MKTKDVLTLEEFQKEDIQALFKEANALRKNKRAKPLAGKTLGLIFQKPSMRTRVSFEIGMYQLGGTAIYLGTDDIQLGVREATKDIAAVVSRYLDGIVARTFGHEDVELLAKYATIPVINGLSDLHHPCQALSDLYTIWEKKGDLKGVRLAYVGDGNNVLHSLLLGAGLVGMHCSVATPRGYEPQGEVVEKAKKLGRSSGAEIQLSNDPVRVVQGADIVYADVWTSMGQEKEKAKRLEAFSFFQVSENLMKKANRGALFMHCLPAHRGEEVTAEVLDGPRSIVFDQAENRLHVQKAVLVRLLGKKR